LILTIKLKTGGEMGCSIQRTDIVVFVVWRTRWVKK